MVSFVAMFHLSPIFCENQSSGFCAILLTNNQSDENKLPGGGKYTTMNVVHFKQGLRWAHK